MSQLLTPLLDLPGVAGAVLSGPDGLSLEAHGQYSELLAAELTALRHTLERGARRGGLRGISRLTLMTDELEIVAVVSQQHLAALALSRGEDTRQAQQALARVALDLTLPAETPHER